MMAELDTFRLVLERRLAKKRPHCRRVHLGSKSENPTYLTTIDSKGKPCFELFVSSEDYSSIVICLHEGTGRT